MAVGSGRPRVTPEGWVDDAAAVSALVDALGAGHRPYAGADQRRPGRPDPVTQDIIITITADLERHHWMFQAANG
ncbi:Starvation-inducible DNA-binding protein OS=Streptomyces albaduncus OX=68172 GN=FHS32_006098 PE=3 SV=1 [Streptomyces griseoloalbus]